MSKCRKTQVITQVITMKSEYVLLGTSKHFKILSLILMSLKRNYLKESKDLNNCKFKLKKKVM